MAFETDNEPDLPNEPPPRIRDLNFILSCVVPAATLFDDDGISMRFMNWQLPEDEGIDDRGQKKPLDPGKVYLSQLDGLRDVATVQRIIAKAPFRGTTPLGENLKRKVLDTRLVLQQVYANTLQKPILLIAITDGAPMPEKPQALFEAIRYASDAFARNPRYGPGAISFQFAQVGKDEGARRFLAQLDSDPGVGKLVDCTSSKFSKIFRLQPWFNPS